MEPEVKKINSLLKFYYQEKVDIALRVKSMTHLVIKGKITKKNFFGKKYIVMKGRDKNPIKIFIEDVELTSIIPLDYEKQQIKKQRSVIPPALRYKILKRDRFTCKSCGARAPDVELEVDHKIPVSKGGKELDENNLEVKCKDCNRGKSDKE